MGNRGNQDYYKIAGTRTGDPDLAGRSRRALSLDEARERRAEHEPTGPQAAPVPPPPVPTTKERRRAARVNRSSERHRVPLAAVPHDESRQESGLRAHASHVEPPTLGDLAWSAALDGARLALHLAERLALGLLRRAAMPFGRTARRLDGLTGGAISRLF